MCNFDPSATVTAQIFQADNTPVTGILTPGAGNDYTVSYVGTPTCELSITLEGTNAVISPSHHLIITYQAQLDPGATVNGEVLTNYAGATQWFSADSGQPRTTFTRTITNGTPADGTDHEDSFDVTVGLAGYYFQKTVSNLETGANPATTAAAGDTLRYHLRVFNVNPTVNGVAITDQLDLTRFGVPPGCGGFAIQVFGGGEVFGIPVDSGLGWSDRDDTEQ